MRKASLAGLIMFFMLLPWGTAWAGPAASSLVTLLPPEQAEAPVLTRGGFAVMLVTAAGIKSEARGADLPGDVPDASWYAPALQALWQEGMIHGYPQGSLRPEQGITNLEAVILTARVLGLPNEISSPATDLEPGDIPYGFNQYAYFQRQGLLPPGGPMDLLTPGAAAGWLAEVFSSEPRARDLMDKCRRALARQQGIATRGKASLKIHSRPGLPYTEEIDRLAITGEVVNEILLPGQMHQVTNLELEGPKNLYIEQFAIDGNLYRRVVEEGGQAGDWQQLNLAPDVSILMRQQQNLGLPANLYSYLRYHYLGPSRVNDQEVLGISFYTRLHTATPVTQLLPPTPLGEGIAAYLDPSEKLIRSFSYWGLIYLNPQTFLPVRSVINLVMAFAPAYRGQPAPLTAMELCYQVDSYTYQGIKINLPF
ncbi:S-layer homology domain-containing protein [Moorella sulfitireducens]|uniref:S-layer homology domain-containing protein n=1 Tax=Neomoorella sulfitireducens TaxID=2972948 RepID=UPI0021ABAD4B|nr:S-layer homology domain-containing protein [Moorella sulfitireducens]